MTTFLTPDQAPTVLLHPLPEGYLLASGERLITNHGVKREVLRLTCWMPDGFGDYEFDEDTEVGLDDFKNDNCDCCDYYFDTDTDDSPRGIDDGHGNPATCVTYRSCCPCYRDGIEQVEWPCAAGYDEPVGLDRSDASGSLPPMAFAIDLHPTVGFSHNTLAWMQKCDADRQCVSTHLQSINCFDNDTVCWGNDNTSPGSLPEIVTTYCDAQCNDDLLKPDEFLAHIRTVRRASCATPLTATTISGGHDSALLVHAAHQPQAYLLLRGSGYPAVNGVILLGLQGHSHDGIDGFITTADSRGRCWFLAYASERPDADDGLRGQLLGQIPHPSTAFLSCSSPAPSSSAPAALAAS